MDTIIVMTLVVFSTIALIFIKFCGDSQTGRHELINTRWVRKGEDPFYRVEYVVKDVREDWVKLQGVLNGYDFHENLPIPELNLLYNQVLV